MAHIGHFFNCKKTIMKAAIVTYGLIILITIFIIAYSIHELNNTKGSLKSDSTTPSEMSVQDLLNNSTGFLDYLCKLDESNIVHTEEERSIDYYLSHKDRT